MYLRPCRRTACGSRPSRCTCVHAGARLVVPDQADVPASMQAHGLWFQTKPMYLRPCRRTACGSRPSRCTSRLFAPGITYGPQGCWFQTQPMGLHPCRPNPFRPRPCRRTACGSRPSRCTCVHAGTALSARLSVKHKTRPLFFWLLSSAFFFLVSYL